MEKIHGYLWIWTPLYIRSYWLNIDKVEAIFCKGLPSHATFLINGIRYCPFYFFPLKFSQKVSLIEKNENKHDHVLRVAISISVDLSVHTILRSLVWIPSTPSRYAFPFIVKLTLYYICHRVKKWMEIDKKKPGLSHSFFKKTWLVL